MSAFPLIIVFSVIIAFQHNPNQCKLTAFQLYSLSIYKLYKLHLLNPFVYFYTFLKTGTSSEAPSSSDPPSSSSDEEDEEDDDEKEEGSEENSESPSKRAKMTLPTPPVYTNVHTETPSYNENVMTTYIDPSFYETVSILSDAGAM